MAAWWSGNAHSPSWTHSVLAEETTVGSVCADIDIFSLKKIIRIWFLSKIFCFLSQSASIYSGKERKSFYFPLLALLVFPVALLKDFIGWKPCSYSVSSSCFLQENRQFGSKMTDSKYFTTTKKGLITYFMFINSFLYLITICIYVEKLFL